ncbi:class I SAM-dependent methyltransferase [Massilia sp. LXY-6]|uniref:class I SAM-dependent methyltransferase n=1 Tax=Massilia sp. LXY-6 TaxID=3379823 RepID=UPI003EE3616E
MKKTATPMRLRDADGGPVLDERVLLDALPLASTPARALELGCGTARQTRLLAAGGKFASILALEVDRRQHEKNLAIDDLPGVQFALGGAQEIPARDAGMDAVFLFKSLHHVPIDLLGRAFTEMHRVLAPGGLVYISEPVFGGDYNEILRLFHDEERVREAAFEATRDAVDKGLFELVSQTFFLAPVRYKSFADFEQKVIQVTHTEHRLSTELLEWVRAKFESHLEPDGARFLAPFRVDLLRKA